MKYKEVLIPLFVLSLIIISNVMIINDIQNRVISNTDRIKKLEIDIKTIEKVLYNLEKDGIKL